MATIDYEEGYFKLKKSNEDLTTLINKVINDFKQTKSQLLSEKDKNSVVVKRNVSLEKQVTEITTRYDAQFHELEDLRDEVATLRTYTKAVEGVAENFCGKNMETESKYKKLKRQSTLMFSKFAMDTNVDINLDDTDDIDSPLTPCTPSTPVSVVTDLSDIKKPYEEKLEKEKLKKISLRQEIKDLKSEIETLNENINALKSELDERKTENKNLQNDLEIIMIAHTTLKKDHEEMLQCFSPYLKMKTENLALKRTSALLVSDIDNDGRIIQFSQIVDELKNESILKDLKIKELESHIDSSSLAIEITSLKLQLDEASDKVVAANKERETLKHENRILREQKGGPGVAAPPPPAPPPPPPPPPSSNPLLKLFKGKHSKNNAPKTAAVSAENKLLVDLMSELQTRLENNVKNRQKKQLLKQGTVDVTDSSPKLPFIKLRSNSVPIITSIKDNECELSKVFNKRRIAPIDEDAK